MTSDATEWISGADTSKTRCLVLDTRSQKDHHSTEKVTERAVRKNNQEVGATSLYEKRQRRVWGFLVYRQKTTKGWMQATYKTPNDVKIMIKDLSLLILEVMVTQQNLWSFDSEQAKKKAFLTQCIINSIHCLMCDDSHRYRWLLKMVRQIHRIYVQ